MTERDVQLSLWFHLRGSCACIMPNFTPPGWWECDMAAVTKAGYFSEYEIKLSRADLLADAEKMQMQYVRRPGPQPWRRRTERKHERLRQGAVVGPSRFNFVVPAELLPLVPAWAGAWEIMTTQWGVRVWRRRDGQQLHRHKVDRRFVAEMHRIAYWRFWNMRHKQREAS